MSAGPLDRSRRGSERLERAVRWRGEGIELVATRWEPARHPDRASDRTERHVVEFMLAGGFAQRTPRGRALSDPNRAVLFRPDEDFEIEHPDRRANRGLSVRIAPDALARWWPSGAGHLERGATLELQVASEAFLAARALAVRSPDEPALEVGARVVDLLGAVGATASQRGVNARTRARLVHVRELLLDPCRAAPSLDALARAVDWTPWHLAHEFKRCVGVPLQAYARSARLRAACTRLDEGPMSELALAHGFASPRHFSAAFRREFDRTPSQVRDGA